MGVGESASRRRGGVFVIRLGEFSLFSRGILGKHQDTVKGVLEGLSQVEFLSIVGIPFYGQTLLCGGDNLVYQGSNRRRNHYVIASMPRDTFRKQPPSPSLCPQQFHGA
jgi:hypothetical protein